jgi:hypothetical protein
VNNKSLEVVENFSTTGDVQVNAIANRTPWVDMVQYWGPVKSQYFGGPELSDWKTVSQFTSPQCGLGHATIAAGYPAYTNMTIAGSLTGTTGTQVSLGVNIGLPPGLFFGLPVEAGISVSVEYQSTLSLESGHSTTVSIVIWNHTSVSHEVDACFDGDSSSSGGIVAHICQIS